MTRLGGLLLALVLVGCEGESAPTPDAGFAGLGASPEGFHRLDPEAPLRFPEDHGAHPDVRLEWWYLTANLTDAAGEPLGMQWTLFRQARHPPAERHDVGPWAADQLWMAHMAVSRGASHRVAERFARGGALAAGPGEAQAGVTTRPFRAWLDDWALISQVGDEEGDALDRLVLEARGQDEAGTFGYRLDLEARGPLVRHITTGKRRTASDDEPIYLSQPFYRVDGEILLDGEWQPVTGRAWLDREWGNRLMAPWHRGWDWFALHLADGHKLMAYHLRGAVADDALLFGTWIAPDGETTPLDGATLALTPLATRRVAGRELPTRWRLSLPTRGLELVVAARHPARWMTTAVPYWEGAVTVEEAGSGEPLGEGYLEMTGY